MGGGQSSSNSPADVTIQMNHPKFESTKLLQSATPHLMEITTGVEQPEYIKWKGTLNLGKLDPQYLLLPTKEDFSRKGMCGTAGTLKLDYENYAYLLTDEIYNRKGKKGKFEEHELWYLLYSLSSAQNEMKTKLKSKVGDIRPRNVFINAQGHIKVANLLSWPRQSSAFSKVFDNEVTYLAPEDMERLQKGETEDLHSFQSQVYSIGATVLSAATLTDFSDQYNIKSYKFDYEKADKRLKEWRLNHIYSQIFTATVANLCSTDPKKRVNDQELYKWISEYEPSIKSRKDFVIKSAPVKIEHEFDLNRSLKQPTTYTKESVVHSYVPPFNDQIKPLNSGLNSSGLTQTFGYQPGVYHPTSSFQPQVYGGGRVINFPPPEISYRTPAVGSEYTYKPFLPTIPSQASQNSTTTATFQTFSSYSGQSPPPTNLQYFQNLVSPQNGRIEQTVYVTKNSDQTSHPDEASTTQKQSHA